MIEIPEAAVLSRQINEVLPGRMIASVVPMHNFACFYGDTDGRLALTKTPRPPLRKGERDTRSVLN